MQGDLILAAGRVRRREKTNEKKKHEKNCPTQNTPRKPQQPADRDQLETAGDEKRPPRWPYSLASIDPGFVEIGLVQLSQSVKRRMLHMHTQTDGQTN